MSRHTQRTIKRQPPAKASPPPNAKPTDQSYPELQQAFDFSNAQLFDDQLPACLITLQRRKNTYGYFSSSRFTTADGKSKTDEIALNPWHFHNRPLIKALATLAHEMVHLWQQHFGKPGRGRYHNKEWGNRMESIGLMPSSTGEPGGKRTGQRVTHYILAGGPYELAAKDLLATGYAITWGDMEAHEPSSNNPKFTCPSCGLNARAKPSARFRCEDCDKLMVFCTVQKQTELGRI